MWQDPNMEGWNYQTLYAFHVTHRPSIGLIRYEITALMTCGIITIQYKKKQKVQSVSPHNAVGGATRSPWLNQ